MYNEASYNGYKSLDSKSPMLKDYFFKKITIHPYSVLLVTCIMILNLYNDYLSNDFKKGHSLSEVGGRKFHVYKTISTLKRKNTTRHCIKTNSVSMCSDLT